MSKLQWREVPLECDEHGVSCEIETTLEQPGPGDELQYICHDGDRVRCPEGCTGWMSADGDAWPNWDEPEETEEPQNAAGQTPAAHKETV
jgi:hypothetical protein